MRGAKLFWKKFPPCNEIRKDFFKALLMPRKLLRGQKE